MAQKAVNEKWEITKRTALKLGVKYGTVHQWKSRRRVPGDYHIALIKAAGGRLAMDDFIIAAGSNGDKQ